MAENRLLLSSQYAAMNIRIANISLNTTDTEIRKLFSSYGNVDSALVNRNSLNGRSLKSGQVDMPVAAQARQAIASLDKTMLDGKIISVSEQPSEFY
jgi:RNA recognition motif-containing protein